MRFDGPYYPLHVFLQRIDEFGVEVGEAMQSQNDAMIHCQIYDFIKNPRVVDEDPDAHFKGEFVVQEREFSEHKWDGIARNRYLTIYLKPRG